MIDILFVIFVAFFIGIITSVIIFAILQSLSMNMDSKNATLVSGIIIAILLLLFLGHSHIREGKIQNIIIHSNSLEELKEEMEEFFE